MGGCCSNGKEDNKQQIVLAINEGSRMERSEGNEHDAQDRNGDSDQFTANVISEGSGQRRNYNGSDDENKLKEAEGEEEEEEDEDEEDNDAHKQRESAKKLFQKKITLNDSKQDESPRSRASSTPDQLMQEAHNSSSPSSPGVSLRQTNQESSQHSLTEGDNASKRLGINSQQQRDQEAKSQEKSKAEKKKQVKEAAQSKKNAFVKSTTKKKITLQEDPVAVVAAAATEEEEKASPTKGGFMRQGTSKGEGKNTQRQKSGGILRSRSTQRQTAAEDAAAPAGTEANNSGDDRSGTERKRVVFNDKPASKRAKSSGKGSKNPAYYN